MLLTSQGTWSRDSTPLPAHHSVSLQAAAKRQALSFKLRAMPSAVIDLREALRQADFTPESRRTLVAISALYLSYELID